MEASPGRQQHYPAGAASFVQAASIGEPPSSSDGPAVRSSEDDNGDVSGSYSHLTYVAAAMAMRNIDAVLKPFAPPTPSTSVTKPLVASSNASTTAGAAAANFGIMKVSEVQDPIRVAAERQVLFEKYGRQHPRLQRIHPGVFQRHMAGSSVGGSASNTCMSQSSTKRRKVAPKHAAASAKKPDEQVYSPLSLPHLLARLATFTLSNYSLYKKARIPIINSDYDYLLGASNGQNFREARWKAWIERQLGPVNAARLGWHVLTANHSRDDPAGGRERLNCGTCRRIWSVEDWLKNDMKQTYRDVSASKDSSEEEAMAADDQATVLWKNHHEWCPWRVKWSAPSLYSLPPHVRPTLLDDVYDTAASLIGVLQESSSATTPSTFGGTIQCTTPLTEYQCATLFAALREVGTKRATRTTDEAAASATGANDSFLHASEACQLQASLLALFGWQLCNSNVAYPSLRGFSIGAEGAVLQCTMCQRKIGLWSFLPSCALGDISDASRVCQTPKRLDVVKEHRDFCAYVVPTHRRDASSKSRREATFNDGLEADIEDKYEVEEEQRQGQLTIWQVRLQTVLGHPLYQRGSTTPTTKHADLLLSSHRSGGDVEGADHGAEEVSRDAGLRNLNAYELLKRLRDVL
ncbi:hypothetical protein K437DRAFT_253681 [Tilletiaria anomala UBC 951]|uniref:Zf-C3HC-domain-containing protein n=1 Tax=Tilletiaria anomala (strain ATCC 24038 / CBS 436.72 / UBC 951) TaxID=1037660 RepID=A0A066WGC4_TILAU|nr:uncharacterized protein K437DRAFT_253681 [Tilletiaria anomala UBC 951]KDN53027.1 hypothetical protein K437DRAFT_253681 [Tilletiaria anomala UBC 951]